MSLSEFHAATESSSGGGGGGGGASLGGGGGIGGVPASVGQTVRINWADEMEKLDDSAPTDFVFDRSKLPTAAKSNLAPDFDLESVPKQPPFTAFISNVSFEADESKIRGFFRDSSILNVRLPLDERGRFKGQGYIDFADRESLITALQRNEESFFNRAMKVVLESKSRHYGGRGGANDSGERASDEADWRSRPAPRDQESSGGPLKSFSFHNDPMRQGGGNPRYQNRDGGRDGRDGGAGGGGGGYQRRNNYNNSNYNNNRERDGQNAWQHSNNRSGGGGGGGEYHQGDRPPRRNNYQKFEGGHQRRNEGEQREHRESGGEQEKQQPTSTPTSPPEGPSERPKLKLAPRTLPVAEEPDAQASASAIFGSARPVNTAARERMIEEKLQREAKAKADAAAAAAAADADVEATPEPESDTPVPPVAEQLPTSPPQQQQHGGNRSHKTSVSSDHKDSAGEFHTVGGHQTHYGGRGGGRGGGDRRAYKNEGGRGDRDRDQQRQQRLTPSESFTSGGNKYQNTRQPYKPRGGEHGGGGGHYQQHDRVHRGHDETSSGATQHQRSTENPWKTKSAAAELFSSNAGATTTVGDSPSSNRGSARTSESHPAAEQDAERSPASHQHQRRVNTNTNNSNRPDRKPHGSGDFQNSRGGPRGDNNNRRGNYNNNNRGGGKQLGRQGGGGERDKVSEKREYQPRPPRDFAAVAAAPQTKQETGLNNKFAGLAIDVEDVDYDNDNDDEEEEEDEEHEDDEQHQKEQHVEA